VDENSDETEIKINKIPVGKKNFLLIVW